MKVSLTTRKGKPNMIRSSSRKGKKRKRDPPPPQPPQPEAEEDDTPISSIACLNNVYDMDRFEESEDCFILGYDPSNSDNTAPNPTPLDDDSAAQNPNTNDDLIDLSVIAEKGQVACRDFPHSRHVCAKYPFNTTSHASHCELCFCYVCDSPAPCKFWSSHLHCDAEDSPEQAGLWEVLRMMQKSGRLDSEHKIC